MMKMVDNNIVQERSIDTQCVADDNKDQTIRDDDDDFCFANDDDESALELAYIVNELQANFSSALLWA